MKISLKFTPESYAEFMNLDLDYVKTNWEDIHKKLIEEANQIFGSNPLTL